MSVRTGKQDNGPGAHEVRTRPPEQRQTYATDTARAYDLNGFFEVRDNPISREGVFPYSGGQIQAPDPGRIYQVYRPAEELAAADTLASFRLMPIIDDHTMLGAGFAAAEDVGVHGVIGENVRVSDGVMTANLKIFSQSLAEKIKSGKTELSCGYRCVYDFTPGEWNGMKYDAVQRQIRGNHLALVDEGRMGPQVAILDHMIFTVDAKEQTTAMDEELKAMLAAIVARLEKLEAGEVGEKKPMADGDMPPPPAADAETGTTEAKVDPEAAKAAAGATDEDMPAKTAEAMDAMSREITALRAQVSGMVVMDEAAVVKTLARKTELADKLARHVGTFDHSSMTFDQVVAYGVGKLGLTNVPKGSEAVALDAALQVRALPTPYASTTDSKSTGLGAAVAKYTAGA